MTCMTAQHKHSVSSIGVTLYKHSQTYSRYYLLLLILHLWELVTQLLLLVGKGISIDFKLQKYSGLLSAVVHILHVWVYISLIAE